MVKKKAKKNVPNGLKPLRELALHSPYTMGYLSLMARRKQLKVRKIGRAWYSSMADIKEFEDKMKKQKAERNEQLRKSYIEKAEKVKISVMSDRKADQILQGVEQETQERSFGGNGREQVIGVSTASRDTIFDEVQSELEEILKGIRAKEKKLRHNYMVHRGDILEKGLDRDWEKEKQATEDLSGKLIDNMGRLLRTAKDIHSHSERRQREFDSHHQDFDFERLTEDNEHLLGNYHKDNFLSVPYSYFPFEDSKQLARQHALTMQNKILLFVSGIMVFVAVLLLALILFQ